MSTDDIDLDDPNEKFNPDERVDDLRGVARPTDVEEAINELKLCVEAEGDQRELEEADLAFDAGEQWPDEIKLSRAKQIIDGIEIPPRPMLTIPKLDQPVQLVINQQRRAHLGIKVSAESADAERETADVLAGIMRHIQTKSNAELARNWSFERGTKAGRGYYRVLTRYVDSYGTGAHWSDQEITIKRILNQGSVYLDPYATETDWCDGMWGQIGGWVSAREHARRWPHSVMSTQVIDGDDFDIDQANVEPTWMSQSINGKALKGVRVMERFRVTEKTRTRVAYVDSANSNVQHEEYLDADPKKATARIEALGESIRARRETSERTVRWMKLNGLEVLESEPWPGKYVPIIPVIGREQFFRNTRRWVGMIRPAMDGQRLFNYAATAAVEKEALDTKAPWIGYEGQFKGHETAWSQSAIKNFPYLQVAPITIGGQPAPLPQRNSVGPNLDGSLALLHAADNFIKASTFTYDPSLGASSGSDSGRKVLALQQQGDQGNSHYLDNLATVSMPYEAKVLLDLIPHFYDRPGRIQQILDIEGDEPREVMLNAPFVKGEDGRPQRVPQEMIDQGVAPKKMQHFDLAKGAYTAVVSIGKNYESRLREGGDEIGKVLEAAPDLLKIIGDVYFKYRDFPGHQEIADRMKKMLPPELQDKGDDETDPKALQAKIAQMEQSFGELKQAYEEASKAIETKQVEAMGRVKVEEVKAHAQQQLEQFRVQGEERLAMINAEMQIRITQIKAGIEAQTSEQELLLKASIDTEAREDEQRHEIAMLNVEHQMDADDVEREHEQALDTLGTEQAHDDVEGDRERAFQSGEADASRQHESAEGEATREHASSEAEAAATREAETAGDESD